MGQERGDFEHANHLEGRFSNDFVIGYDALEFVLDFGQFYPETGVRRYHTRIMTLPIYAKALAAFLQEAVGQYEQDFGELPEPEEEV